jgi:malonate transporter MadM subunit
MERIIKLFEDNGLVVAFFVVGATMLFSEMISKKIARGKVPGAAIAIIAGLVLAYIGGAVSGGKKGIADVRLFQGFALMGSGMLRDFTIVATAMGASIVVMRKTGLLGAVSLIMGVLFAFVFGVLIAYIWGIRDPVELTTIGAGSCTYIVGPVTGAALGASSEMIALSIATGVVKAIVVAIGTPIFARSIGLNNPHTAMIFGGMIGTNAGVMAGLAATDPKLVPYGALTATFYTGLGCLLCPSVLFLLVRALTA